MASKHEFKANVKPRVIKVTEEWHHHKEIFVTTGDLSAYQKMLDSVTTVEVEVQK